ncbi:hypothetical protein C0992_002645 [Termitomyces sp. T32_za158]|nr:hypothetical protein C0992_002645 [Termitomyces sp. T32_za158]
MSSFGDYLPLISSKLSHGFESDTLLSELPARSSSVIWPPTSSSPNTSPNSSSLLQTPTHPRRLSPSTPVLSSGALKSCQVIVRPQISPKDSEFDDELPPVLWGRTSDQVAPPTLHTSTADTNDRSSPSPKPSNEYATPPSSVSEVVSAPLNIHERLLSPAPSPFSLEFRTRSPSPDPILLSDVPPSRSTASEDLTPQGTLVHEDLRQGDTFSVQDISFQNRGQSPVPTTHSFDIRVPSDPRMSPSIPTATQNPPQDSLIHDSPISLPDRAPAPIDGEPDDTPLDDIDISNLSRYPLRKRAPAQLKPYTVEKYQYKQALSANPDAIVNMRDRMSRDHYDHTDDHLDETQAPWQPPEETQGDSDDEQWNSRSRVNPREDSAAVDPTPSEERPVQYSELLQDLSSSDNEESKSMQRFSKEAKRLERQRRKVKAEEERQARLIREGNDREKARTRPKAFPVEKPRKSTSRTLSLSTSSVSLPACLNEAPAEEAV